MQRKIAYAIFTTLLLIIHSYTFSPALNINNHFNTNTMIRSIIPSATMAPIVLNTLYAINPHRIDQCMIIMLIFYIAPIACMELTARVLEVPIEGIIGGAASGCLAHIHLSTYAASPKLHKEILWKITKAVFYIDEYTSFIGMMAFSATIGIISCYLTKHGVYNLCRYSRVLFDFHPV